MPLTATAIRIDGTATDGADPWIDSLVYDGVWTGSNGGTVAISYALASGVLQGPVLRSSWTTESINALNQALAVWESVANIDFVRDSGTTNTKLRFWVGDRGSRAGHSDGVKFLPTTRQPPRTTRWCSTVKKRPGRMHWPGVDWASSR